MHFTALPPLLFDLEADPGETRDLSQDPGHQAVLLDMAQKMLSWRMAHDERVLTNMRLTGRGVVAQETPRRPLD